MARRTSPSPTKTTTTQEGGCGCALAVLFVFVVMPAIAYATYARLGPVKSAPPIVSGRSPVSPVSPVSSSVWRADDDPFRVGWCAPASSSTTGRSRSRYQRMSGGSAQWLRKKVVIVHLRVEAPGADWSNDERMRLQLAANAVTKLYEREAKRYGITDLDVRTVEWPLLSVVPVPTISPGARDVMSAEAVRALRRSVKAGLLGGEQRTLDGIAGGYKKQGYHSVAFLIYVPTMSTARSFASPHDDSDPSAELAFIFESKTLLAMSTAAAHEALHLFGADDLYDLTPADDADARDIMSSCRGFHGNGIGEVTAWAIGWRAAPPARGYRF